MPSLSDLLIPDTPDPDDQGAAKTKVKAAKKSTTSGSGPSSVQSTGKVKVTKAKADPQSTTNPGGSSPTSPQGGKTKMVAGPIDPNNEEAVLDAYANIFTAKKKKKAKETKRAKTLIEGAAGQLKDLGEDVDTDALEAALTGGTAGTTDGSEKLKAFDAEGNQLRISRAVFEANPGEFVVQIDDDEFIVATEHGERPFPTKARALEAISSSANATTTDNTQHEAFRGDGSSVHMTVADFNATPVKQYTMREPATGMFMVRVSDTLTTRHPNKEEALKELDGYVSQKKGLSFLRGARGGTP